MAVELSDKQYFQELINGYQVIADALVDEQNPEEVERLSALVATTANESADDQIIDYYGEEFLEMLKEWRQQNKIAIDKAFQFAAKNPYE